MKAILAFIIAIIAGAGIVEARDSRFTAAVALVNKGPDIEQFLAAPVSGYVHAFLRFGKDMPDDVLMFIDEEFMDGVSNPLFYPGGDWMAYVGVLRNGAVLVAQGTAGTMAGTPSTFRTFAIFSLGQRLQPDTWYLLRTRANFGTRHYVSFLIEGENLRQEIDLSALTLDYPNYLPFSGRTMTYYVGAARSGGLLGGTPVAYFDAVQGGSSHVFFYNGFEQQTVVGPQPPFNSPIDLNSYVQGQWYKERDEALFTIQQSPFAVSGKSIGVADANLNGP